MSIDGFDTSKFTLGTLCKHRHEWGNTGKSLRYMKTSQACVECTKINSRATKQRKKQQRHEGVDFLPLCRCDRCVAAKAEARASRDKTVPDGVPPFDAKLFGLGILCSRGHDYYGTGKSLRRLSNKHKTGLGNCLECDRLNKKQDYQKVREQRHQRGEVIKTCECDACAAEWERRRRLSIQKHREYTKGWFERHPEYTKERYHANPEKYRRIAKFFRLKYPEKHKEAWKNYYSQNRDQLRERVRQYRRSDRGKMAKRVLRIRRKLRLKTAHQVPYKPDELRQRLKDFDNACAYCGKAEQITLDHFIPISKGGTDSLWNIVPACHSCNSSKNASLAQDWYPRQSFFNRDRWKKILTVLGKSESSVDQLPLL